MDQISLQELRWPVNILVDCNWPMQDGRSALSVCGDADTNALSGYEFHKLKCSITSADIKQLPVGWRFDAMVWVGDVIFGLNRQMIADLHVDISQAFRRLYRRAKNTARDSYEPWLRTRLANYIRETLIWAELPL